MDAALGLGLIALGIVVYFLPSIVAHLRVHHQENAIVLLNLFLGWTFLGWVAALVWAAMAVRVDPAGAQSQQAASKPVFPKLIAGMIAIGVVVIGGGYLGYNAKKQAEAREEANSEQRGPIEQTVPSAEVQADTVAYLPIDEIVVNLADPGGDHVAQIGITFELRSKSEAAKVNAFMPAIRSKLIDLISRQTAEELLTQAGKERLAEDILTFTTTKLGESVVKGVMFSSFVVQ